MKPLLPSACTLPLLLAVLPSLVGGLGAQSQPNECCLPESVESLFSVALAVSNSMSEQFAINDNPPAHDSPVAPFMTVAGTTGIAFASSALADPARSFTDAGEGVTTITVYGSVEYRITMPPVSTGLLGLAGLYPNVLVIDMSEPAWTAAGTHLKALTGEELPVPYMAPGALVGEGFGLQPRPGNMPGQYIYQVGNDFYHYGGPLDTGANPQTTAVYIDGDDGPPPAVVTLSNNLSGAQLWRFVTGNYLEVRHVDGTIARFEECHPYSGTPPSNAHLWRLASVRDPYDNVATLSYNLINQLESIAFPSGITQTWTWSTANSHSSTPPVPNWPGWTSANDRLEISYTFSGTAPTEIAARTWGLVFDNNTTGAYINRHFGGRLHRTYSAQRSILEDLAASGPYTIGTGSEVTGQVVHEFGYNSTTHVMTETQRVHSGTVFDNTLTVPSNLPDRQILETVYNQSGRVTAHVRSMTSEGLTFSYPTTNLRSSDLLPGTYMSAIEAANDSGNGTRRLYEYDYRSGRLYSVTTTPASGYAGRPRATHASGENSDIGEFAGKNVEPEWMQVYNIYDATCVCQKPIERREYSYWDSDRKERIWNFEYDPTSRLVTKRKAPNPSTASGAPAQVEWTYTYTQLTGSGGTWGAWVPSVETTPDGQYVYSYSDPVARAVPGHGEMARTMTRSLAGVRIQDTLTGATTASSTPVVETVWRNLSSLPANLPKMGNVNGQVRKTIDGDGVEAVYEYSTAGYLTATIVGGGLKTNFVPDAVGNTTSITEVALASRPATTTITMMSGVAAVTDLSSASAGIDRESKGYYDRFGHLTVVRQNNLSSTGAKPNKHGVSGTGARDWVEQQFHYHFNRLMETYVDRKPLNEAAAAGSLFLVSMYDYASDGRLSSIVGPNGAETFYDFDGFGTLYRTYTVDPTSSQTVRGPKTFVSPFLELTGRYEYTGSDHLWTLITRNGAGAVTQIQEPSTAAPGGYSPLYLNGVLVYFSTGGTIHHYQLDSLGRVIAADSAWGSTTLSSLELRHDQLSRQIWRHDVLLAGGTGDHHKAWRYAAGKATQLYSVEETGLAPTTYEFNALGLLKQVKDGFSTGNFVVYEYHSGTPFLESVTRTDLDPSGTPRVTATTYDVNAFGQVTAIKDGSPQLVHSYAYNSFGRVDKYTDPMGRVQKFLPDALGRIVEHARLGDSSDVILNSATFEDSGATDGRSKVSRYDGIGNVTITHVDFAGRPFIVQNPGGDVTPTPSSKNQMMSLYAEYDGASRISAIYDGDLGKTEYFRDGPGRVILRRLVNQTIGSRSSQDNITQWNTLDWFRRDGLGRIGMQDYWGTPTWGSIMGGERFDYDSLGRVHSEKFQSAFAPANILEVNSAFTNGSRFRSTLAYQDNFNQESAQMSYGRDAIGRLSELQWDRAPGSIGSMNVLAQYSWAGGLRRGRTVRYGNTAYPQGQSAFSYDGYGRLSEIKDDIYTSANTFTTKSKFEYEYDDASNLKKEKYATVGARAGDRFAYDAYHRLAQAWMGVDTATMTATADPTTFSASAIHEALTYSLDHANNRSSTSSQTGTSPLVTGYTVQGTSHAQGASNRYDTMLLPGAPVATVLEYDDRGNLKYDGRFLYRYDYVNRLQEVYRVLVDEEPPVEEEELAMVQAGALDAAQQEISSGVRELYTRLPREHADPVFRARMRANITGGVLRITGRRRGTGGRAGWLPATGTLELLAVYVYDGFNRRTLSVVYDTVSETQIHVWDGWRQVSQHKIELVGGVWKATPTKQFVWGSRLDELVAYRRSSGSTWENYYLLHGGQDTAAKLVNASGAVVEQYEYDPYGKATVYDGSGALVNGGMSSGVGLPFLWKGIRLDNETGLLYMRNRYYSTHLGRFLTQDPPGTWGDPLNGGNAYGYVGDRPLVAADVFGLQGGIHVVVTHFTPFKGGSTNASEEYANAVKGELDSRGVSNNVVPLPAKEWGEADQLLEAAVVDAQAKHPGAKIYVVASGEAPRNRVQYESIAKNLRRCIDDDKGNTPGSKSFPTVNNTGEDPATTKRISRGMRHLADNAKMPASRNAGGYICEATFYKVLGMEEAGLIQGGLFVHVPNAAYKPKAGTDDAKLNADAPEDLAKAMAGLSNLDKGIQAALNYLKQVK